MSLDNYLHVPSKRDKKLWEWSSHTSKRTFSHLEFYQLKIGDEFSIKRAKYKKISEDTAQKKNGKVIPIWPSTDVTISPMTLDEIKEKYPITEYEF